MTTKFNSLIPLKGDDPPWLYAMGSEACIDLSGYTTREDWEHGRKHAIETATRRHRRTDVQLLISVLLVVLSVALPTHMPAWLPAAASTALGISVLLNVLSFFRFRAAKTNMVIAAPNTQLHREILLLSRTLVAIHSLKEHLREHEDLEVQSIEQVDPDALIAMAKALLQLEFPRINAEYVRTVRTDIARSLYQTTGVQLAAE